MNWHAVVGAVLLLAQGFKLSVRSRESPDAAGCMRPIRTRNERAAAHGAWSRLHPHTLQPPPELCQRTTDCHGPMMPPHAARRTEPIGRSVSSVRSSVKVEDLHREGEVAVPRILSCNHPAAIARDGKTDQRGPSLARSPGHTPSSMSAVASSKPTGFVYGTVKSPWMTKQIEANSTSALSVEPVISVVSFRPSVRASSHDFRAVPNSEPRLVSQSSSAESDVTVGWSASSPSLQPAQTATAATRPTATMHRNGWVMASHGIEADSVPSPGPIVASRRQCGPPICRSASLPLALLAIDAAL